ncbi:MAG: cyanophycinase [Bacteroidales bacterium]
MKKRILTPKRLLLVALLSLLSAPFVWSQSYVEQKIDAKGYLYIVGGGAQTYRMVEQYLNLAGKGKKRVVVIPFANKNFETADKAVKKLIMQYGVDSYDKIICEKREVDSKANLKLIEKANVVWFTGGHQKKLSDWMLDSELLKRIKEKYKEGTIVVGGSSAGASIMGDYMPTGRGFAFLENIYVHQHYLARKRTTANFAALRKHPTLRALGIDESTAIIVKPDATFDVIGKSRVLVFEPQNLHNKKEGEGESFIVRILSEGDSYKF